MTFGICTLGCKVNFYESEFVINLLKKNNYVEKSFNDFCDVYIINTCSVTNTSDSKSMKMIRSARKRNNNACIVVMGCFVEKSKDNLDNIKSIANIIIGNKDKSKIVELLNDYFLQEKQITRMYKYIDKNTFEDMYIDNFYGRTRAFVKIQDGCENFCSYCIIPFLRGKLRSKDKDRVLEEITSLVNNGYKEIVLTGIHTGSYGSDINYSFSNLLKDIINIDNLMRLRISSIEVTELDDDVLALIKESNIIVDHLHIPIQSGSDKILKLMNRKYDLKYFEEKIKVLRSIKKDISISTDLIVGFPNESDKDFNDTIDTVKRIGFSKIHVFPYSIREGTKAATFDNQIPNNIKKDRARILIEVSKKLEIEYMKKFLNREVEVLIEEEKNGYSYGHTSNFLHARVLGKYEKNSFVRGIVKEIDYPYISIEEV